MGAGMEIRIAGEAEWWLLVARCWFIQIIISFFNLPLLIANSVRLLFINNLTSNLQQATCIKQSAHT